MLAFPSLSNGVKRAFLVAACVAGFALGLLGFPSAGGPTPAHALACGASTQSRAYVAQLSTVAAYGIDGFIGYTPGSLFYPQCDKISLFFNVQQSNSSSGIPWVQAGVRIGYLTEGYYNTTYQAYSEQNNCLYSRATYGTPTTSNALYYISYTGNSATVCSVTFYEYAIRRDDWFNSPIAYRYLNVPSPQWSAQTELGTTRSPSYWEWTGNPTYGAPSSDLSHGMAWYNQPVNSWNEWSFSTGATSHQTYPATPPISYCLNVAYRAFTSKWGIC